MNTTKMISSTITKVIFLLNCLLLFNSSQVLAATRLASQDFETTEWMSQFQIADPTGTYVRTTNAPHSGNNSLRWNQHKSRVDPITGKSLAGASNRWLDWRGNWNIVTKTPHGMFLRFWYRHDDYNNDQPESGSARKLLYFVDNVYGVEAMYMARQNGNLWTMISYSNNGYSRDWAYDNWGYSNMYLDFHGATKGLDGRWRKFEVYFNYDEHYMQLWFDGVLATPRNSKYMELYPTETAAGKIKWNPALNLHYKGFQFMYYSSDRDLANEADRTGYYSGIQIDDLEVWNGLPSDTGTDLYFQIDGEVQMGN